MSDSVQQLRDWGSQLERALGFPITIDQNGMLGLVTKAGRAFSIAPVPRQRVLIFTGLVGVADDAMPAEMLRALLMLNADLGAAGMAGVAMVPHTRDITFRLTWQPAEEHWNETAFGTILAEFAENVDVLSSAVATRDASQLIGLSPPPDEAAIPSNDQSFV